MKRLALAAVAALVMFPAAAQERRVASDADVLTQGTLPAPGYPFRIVIPWGSTPNQIHFRVPFKAIRIGDSYVVGATPQTDHIISFTGLSPGETSLVLEPKDAKEANWVGTVQVYRPLHEVKVFTPKAGEKKDDGQKGASVTVVNNNSTNLTARESDEAEYKSLLCNEVGCRPVPKPSN